MARMRKDISIDLVRDARNNEITAFKVSYSSPDPRIAQQVTTELTNLFINENNKFRQEQSEGTTKFIEDQLEAGERIHPAGRESKGIRGWTPRHSAVAGDQ